MREPQNESKRTPVNPETVGVGPMAWLYRLMATIKALFGKLPETDAMPEETGEDWIQAMAWRYVYVPRLHSDGTVVMGLDGKGPIMDEKIEILKFARTDDPKETDWILADVISASKGTGAWVTLNSPEGAYRLGRKARRAVMARVRRSFRRSERKENREFREDQRLARQERDQERRAELQRWSTARRVLRAGLASEMGDKWAGIAMGERA